MSLWAHQDIYNVQTLANGTVVISRNFEPFGRLQPQVFLEGWKNGTLHSSGDNPKFDAIIDMPSGGQVGLNFSVKVSGPRIQVHYRLTPLVDVQTISARAALYLNYSDWMNEPYQMGNTTGRFPSEVQKGYFIAGTDQGPVSLGPTRTQGLGIQVQSEKLYASVEDDRNWGTYLGLMLNHHESADRSWLWKAGEAKDFDFTLTLPGDEVPPPVPQETQGFTGNWYGTFTQGDLHYHCSFFIKDHDSSRLSVFYNFENMDQGWVTQGVQRKDRDLDLTADDWTMKFHLNPSGDSLTGQATGKIFAVDYHFDLDFKRGLNFTTPRTDEAGKAVTDYVYRKPQTLTDGWTVSDLHENPKGLQVLQQGIREILQGRYPNVQGLVIAQRGRLLVDEYFQGYGPNDNHMLQSASKSVFSLLFGIAVDQGLINTTQKLYDFFPEYRAKGGWDPRKEKITMDNLLSMSSGFACDDWVPETDCHKVMWTTPDWLDFVLSQPMNHEPGEHFAYCNDCLEALGAVLAQKSGLSVPDFAQKYLYGPLDFQNNYWLKVTNNGLADIAGSIFLRPRDMAKLGELFLERGKWKGQQVVSEKWLEESTQPRISLPENNPLGGNSLGFQDYGYLWWLGQMPSPKGKVRILAAAGLGGQYIFVVPDWELVCVLTCGNYAQDDMGMDFFKTYVLGAFH